MSSLKPSWLLIVLVVIAVGFISWQNLAAQPDHGQAEAAWSAATSTPQLAGSAAIRAVEPHDTPAVDDSAERIAGLEGEPDAGMDVPGSSLEEETGETWLRYERRPLIPSRTSRVVEAFTEPYRDIAVAASEMGTLSEIAVQEGQTVRVGDVVAAMDQDVLRAALEVARRSMSSEGALKSAQADLARKAEELSKLTGLKERGHASQQEVDRVDADRQVAEARLLAVREDLEVKQLEARRIEAQIEERIIRSPIDGIVTELRRESGEFVSPSDPVIARVVQLDPLLVVFAVPVEYRDELQAGQSVTVKFGEANPESRTGMIEFVAPTPDPSNSSVRVKVRIANPGRKIRSGERTTLDLDTQQVESSDNQRDMLRPDPQRPESP